MSHRTAVYLVMSRDEQTLFMMRVGTGYRDGEYGLPSGRVEPGELLYEAVVREASEEIGVVVRPEDLSLSHLVERQTPTGNWLDFFFVCHRWSGEPTNTEPAKCDHVQWLARHNSGVSDYVRAALVAISEGVAFSRYEGE